MTACSGKEAEPETEEPPEQPKEKSNTGGLVLGRDGSRVYTVEGNSGDACKIKSYDLNYQCIKGYGLMNW